VGSAVGLFLTTAQSVIALGVAAIGDVFFSWLGKAPTTASYLAALTAALSGNFVLMVGTFLLALLLPRRTPVVASMSRGVSPYAGRQGSPTSDDDPEGRVRKLHKLATWYRAFADRAGNAAIWEMQLRTAEDAEASRIESRARLRSRPVTMTGFNLASGDIG
jgi:hypothetical protein